MNPFARHGIGHLSASSLTLWREHPGLWAARYLGGVKDEGGPAAWRGLAVEAGLHRILRGSEDVAADALADFEKNCLGEISDEIEAERKLIEPMLKQCAAWKHSAPLIASQLKIEHWLDDVPVPLVGYADFVFEDGLIVDLKTTKACPSSPRPNHVRQVSLYMAARNAPGALLYVTHAKRAFYPLDADTQDRALNDLRSDALSLTGFLSRVDSARDALHCLPVNYDDFRVTPKTKVALENILLAG